MTTLLNNRWVASDNEFATRIEIPDVQGFFAKSVLVEPGFRALFIEKGQSLGELPPGQHTLSNIVDRMKFWTQKTATVIVARQQDVRLELVCPELLTSEFLEVEVTLSVTVRLEDVALFFANLMGSKSTISVEDIRRIVTPFLKQSLWDAVGRMSIKDLVSDQKRFDIESLAPQSLQTALTRYGLRLGTVETLSISHPEYDAQLRRTGQLWLQRQELDFDQQAAQLAADKLFAQIEQQEKTNDLAVLEAQVATDHLEAKQVVRLRRIAIRKEIRAAALANQFDQINSDEELGRFLEQRDKERLLRQDEVDALKSALRDKSTDRVSARAHLLRRLDLEQSAELDGLRIDLDFAQRMKSRQHEIALADLNETDASRRWKNALQKQAEEAEHHRAEAHQELTSSLALSRSSSTDRRTDEAEESLHKQRIRRVDREDLYEDATLKQRITLLEIETYSAKELAQFESERRRKELEAEMNERETKAQNDWFTTVNQQNLAATKSQQELLLQTEKQRADLDLQKSASHSTAELAKIKAEGDTLTAKINAIKGASGFDVMAIAPDVAAHAADVLKSQASATATIASATAQAAHSPATSAREQELRDQLSQSQRDTVDRATAAYREAMQGQQGMFNQFGSTMEAVTKNLAPVAPQVIIPGVTPFGGAAQSSPSTSEPKRVVLCPKCRSENTETDRRCHRCGQEI